MEVDPESRSLVVIGATGDLTARLLLPGLGALVASGSGEDLQLIGSAASDWDDAGWRSLISDTFAEAGATGDQVDRAIREARYIQADVTEQADLHRLLEACDGQPILYFAVPPSVTEHACRQLATMGLPVGSQLVIEKPFGHDATSAQALNDLLTDLVPEDHVHRVDHFLAMATTLNILGLRFANRIVEPVLTSEHVAIVDVVFDEQLALEGRAGYYDSTGALIDMVQSHLLQVLALFAMEPPPTLAARDVRDAKAQVLRATHVWTHEPQLFSRRARYTEGTVGGHHVPAYVEEDGTDPARATETFAEVVLAVDTWRWAGVPFRLRSGKALSNPRTEVTVTFRPPQQVPTCLEDVKQPNRFHIGIDPEKNLLGIDINISGPGHPFKADAVSMERDFGPGSLPPYGDVLKGILEHDPVLSVRGDMAVECWRIVEPVLAAWRNGRVPLQEYEAGSDGPAGWPLTGLPEDST